MATKIGGSGNNKILGGKMADKLFGMGGNDTIKGANGKDLINGGRGNDTLTGGLGDDTFKFGAKSGKDVITDFKVDKDILEIAKGLNGIKTAADVITKAVQSGKDVVISLGGGNTIKLKNVDLDDLKDNPSDHFAVI